MAENEYKELLEQNKELVAQLGTELVTYAVNQLSLKYDCGFAAFFFSGSAQREQINLYLYPDYDRSLVFKASIDEKTRTVRDSFIRALVARRLKTETESIFSERKITASSVIFFSGEDDSEEDNTELKAEDYLEKYKVDSVFFILAVSLSDSEKDLGEALLRCFAEISSRLKRDVVIRAYFFNEGYGECARALFSQPEPTEAWFEAFSPDAVSGFAILDGKPNVSADYISEKLRYNSNGE